jgi:phosphoglycerate dehydrogenase-like enzyme
MRVIAYDPMPDRAYAEEHGIELTDVETLLRSADYVSLHIPHTKENESFINAERLALMKPSAFLINTARGVLVDEAALYDALWNQRIAGAGLDVFRKGPPVGSPLLSLDNVVFLPHSSGMDDNGEAGMANKCIDSILAFSRGVHPGTEYVLNPEVLPASMEGNS